MILNFSLIIENLGFMAVLLFFQMSYEELIHLGSVFLSQNNPYGSDFNSEVG